MPVGTTLPFATRSLACGQAAYVLLTVESAAVYGLLSLQITVLRGVAGRREVLTIQSPFYGVGPGQPLRLPLRQKADSN